MWWWCGGGDMSDPLSVLAPHLVTAITALEQHAHVAAVMREAQYSGLFEVVSGHLAQLASVLSASSSIVEDHGGSCDQGVLGAMEKAGALSVKKDGPNGIIPMTGSKRQRVDPDEGMEASLQYVSQ